MSIRLVGETFHIYMLTKYFHTFYLFGCYSPDGCRVHAIILVLSALFFRLTTQGLSKVTLLLEPAELVSHRTSLEDPEASCSFHGSSCIWGVGVTRW